jgi:NADPH-dependent glutamate synthase beta subunit-like oxidoreductase
MRHIAIVGSGPAGYYTAEAATKAFGDDVQIDIIDQLPVPYGLTRFGVAPDHQSIKAVSKRYDGINRTNGVAFMGNVQVGNDVSIAELQTLYDHVVLATGAPQDRPLDVDGSNLPGVIGSAAFVGWYNGHPDFAQLSPPLDSPGAVIIGNGNVALDVARILAKSHDEFAASDIAAHALDALDDSKIKRISLLGRRGPHQIAMTPKELGELGHLARATPAVAASDLPPLVDDALLEPGVRKSVTLLRSFAVAAEAPKPITIDFDFFARPARIEGDGKVEHIVVERTSLDADLRSVGTGETYSVPCGLVIACIGYQTPPIKGVPYEHGRGRFANRDGRILPGLYCVGWARRGPSGTIGTNRPDGYAIVDEIAADPREPGAKAGHHGLKALLDMRGVDVVTFDEWQKIDAAEIANARGASPREKFVAVSDMIKASGH